MKKAENTEKKDNFPPRIGALWERKSKKGTTFYSGEIELEGKKYYVSVFENKKAKPTHPDFRIHSDGAVE